MDYVCSDSFMVKEKEKKREKEKLLAINQILKMM